MPMSKSTDTLEGLHDIYIDGQLRSVEYHTAQMQILWNELRRMDARLEAAAVSSPRIKSAEEAFYLKSPKFSTNSSAVEMILQESEIRDRYEHHVAEIKRICSALSVLSEEELELLHLYYELHMSIDEIAELQSFSPTSIRRHLDNIRERIRL